MPIYQKVNGVWTLCQRPQVKRNGVWTAVNEAWVRRSGTWVQAYEYDVTPPNPPEIDLSVYEDYATKDGSKQLVTRHINVGVRLPGVDDPDARLVRVLTTYNGQPPTTQFGGTYTGESDHNFPEEPWSEWRYHEYGPHGDTSVVHTKQWQRNYGAGQIIPGDKDYYFTGWALDRNGNWSAANAAKIHIPKDSVGATNVIVKEARFQANNSGSWTSSGFTAGNLEQQNSPRSTGVWFYGNQITNSIGATGAPTIRSAQVFVRREDDNGQANANIFLYWTGYGSPGDLPSPGTGLNKQQVAKIGQLAKGEGQWFNLPQYFWGDLKDNIKGLGLDYKDPNMASAFPEDYSMISAMATNLRCGEVHVVWEEQV